MNIYSSDPKRLIEDYFFEELEKELGVMWLMEKLFTIGTIEDIKAVRKYYGDERVKQEIIKIQWLSKEVLSFLSGIFEIPKENFLTYQLIHGLNISK
jgi:hypothetical protein